MQEKEYYNEIKDLIINNEVNKKVKNYSINRTDLETKYNIGKVLSEAGKHYGESIIKNYSIKLTKEFGKGYSRRNLWLMLKYFLLNQKVQTLSAQLTWSHICELLNINSILLVKENNNYVLYSSDGNIITRSFKLE